KFGICQNALDRELQAGLKSSVALPLRVRTHKLFHIVCAKGTPIASTRDRRHDLLGAYGFLGVLGLANQDPAAAGCLPWGDSALGPVHCDAFYGGIPVQEFVSILANRMQLGQEE